MGHGTTRLPNNNLTAAGSQGKNPRLFCLLLEGMEKVECGRYWLRPWLRNLDSCSPVFSV